MNLRLAGISISDVGIDYLRNNIVEISRPVTFKLIKKDEKENIADVELFIRKVLFIRESNFPLNSIYLDNCSCKSKCRAGP